MWAARGGYVPRGARDHLSVRRGRVWTMGVGKAGREKEGGKEGCEWGRRGEG
jgi:hypothetical protein